MCNKYSFWYLGFSIVEPNQIFRLLLNIIFEQDFKSQKNLKKIISCFFNTVSNGEQINGDGGGDGDRGGAPRRFFRRNFRGGPPRAPMQRRGPPRRGK